MRRLEDRRWRIEGGELHNSKFELINSVLRGCVKTVFILVTSGGINRVLKSSKSLVGFGLCVSGRFVNNFWTAFTSAFALFFGKTFNLLSLTFIPTIHTTNKSDNIVYKLIITK